MSFVYVCYERNYRECALYAGPVNEVEVFGTPELAVEWVGKRIYQANANGFVSEKATDTSDSGVLEKVKRGYFRVEMYFRYQENYDQEYDIVVERKEVQVPEEQIESENYKKFKDILAENISVEALDDCSQGILDSLLIEESDAVIDKLYTKEKCPCCRRLLLLSDLPQYDYVCLNCDENFLECEVKKS